MKIDQSNHHLMFEKEGEERCFIELIIKSTCKTAQMCLLKHRRVCILIYKTFIIIKVKKKKKQELIHVLQNKKNSKSCNNSLTVGDKWAPPVSTVGVFHSASITWIHSQPVPSYWSPSWMFECLMHSLVWRRKKEKKKKSNSSVKRASAASQCCVWWWLHLRDVIVINDCSL